MVHVCVCVLQCDTILSIVNRSFGVLLWEILTKGQFPFAELSDGEVVQGVCYEFQRLLQPISCPDNVYVNLINKIFL